MKKTIFSICLNLFLLSFCRGGVIQFYTDSVNEIFYSAFEYNGIEELDSICNVTPIYPVQSITIFDEELTELPDSFFKFNQVVRLVITMYKLKAVPFNLTSFSKLEDFGIHSDNLESMQFSFSKLQSLNKIYIRSIADHETYKKVLDANEIVDLSIFFNATLPAIEVVPNDFIDCENCKDLKTLYIFNVKLSKKNGQKLKKYFERKKVDFYIETTSGVIYESKI